MNFFKKKTKRPYTNKEVINNFANEMANRGFNFILCAQDNNKSISAIYGDNEYVVNSVINCMIQNKDIKKIFQDAVKLNYEYEENNN